MDEIIKLPEEQTAAAPAEAAAPAAQMFTVVDIHFRNNSKTYYFNPDGLTIKAGDHVIMDTSRGVEFGYCAVGNHPVLATEIIAPLRRILRIANAQDEKINNENQEKEKRAFEVCLQKIQDHKLDMQLVSAECAFDGSKILFFFTADGRVDFRELVKDLASVFRTRIELRQIGVRDKAKMVGGLGVCGRPFCCKQFLDDFQPVSIKMAKTQSLSLNPTKISGVCGRLMCCLKYEQDAYEDLLRTAPKNESFVDTPDGRGTVTDVNLLRQSVKVRLEDHPETINSYKNADIYVIRNGKARKNDPPIPRDFAPISSQPRPAKRQELTEEEAMPEIIFSDSYTVIDKLPELEPEAEVEAVAETSAQGEAKKPHRRRGGRGRSKSGADGGKQPENQQPKAQNEGKKPQNEKKPQGEGKKQGERKPQGDKKPQGEKKPQGDKKPQQDKPTAEGAAQTGDKPKSNNRRRRYPRRRSGGGNGGGGNAPAGE